MKNDREVPLGSHGGYPGHIVSTEGLTNISEMLRNSPVAPRLLQGLALGSSRRTFFQSRD